MDDIQMFFNFLVFIILFVIVISMAYFATKFISKNGNRLMSGKSIKVIESLSLGMDRQIHLIQVGKKYIVVGVFGKSMQLLSELSDKDFDENPNDLLENKSDSFKGLLGKYMGAFSFSNNKVQSSDIRDEEELKIDKNINRIKNLRDLLDTNDKKEDDSLNENKTG